MGSFNDLRFEAFKLNTEEFKEGEQRGLMMGEIKAVRSEVTSLTTAFNNFTQGIGTRMGEAERILGVHNTILSGIEKDILIMQRVVYGFVSLILTSVVVAILKLVIFK